MSTSDATVHLFGIRHHGPGSARSLVHALERLDPDVILIEGPSDASALLPLAARDDLEPPVALLVYAEGNPRDAVIYPFARFSPEWQAIRFALARDRPLRFIDLPPAMRKAAGASAEPVTPDEEDDERAGDPLEPLAIAAGYSDTERWWDQLVESRAGDDLEVFAAVHEMMTVIRAEAAPPPSLRERQREAWMRKAIRAARAERFERIAVVCGAYHTPALADLIGARDDDALLRGIRKVKTAAAWVPWSYERLAMASGYGAGIESPMWYELLWTREPSLGAAWVARAARLLREIDTPISSAHVIETCRLADALAAVRARPLPGLAEYRDATVTVLGAGDAGNLSLIARRWHFDDRLGVVPADFPAAPLQQDLAARQRRLRLPPKAEERLLDLDLREPTDRARSHLLRRLRLLDIPWGIPEETGTASRGTFHEVWRVRWEPGFAVSLIDGSRYGHTVEAAAAVVVTRAGDAGAGLGDLIGLLQEALFADLGEAVPPLVRAVESRASVSSDERQLLEAVPPLVSVVRYGNVRETDVSLVIHILGALVPRVCIGLPSSAVQIDDEAARELRSRMSDAERALRALGDSGYVDLWLDAMARIAANDTSHPLLAGYAHRLLYDANRLDVTALGAALSRALSPANEAPAAAGWLEGLLAGSSLFLIHEDRLRVILDTWLRTVGEETFVQALPLLRRTFAEFPPAERRALGERLRPGRTRDEAGERTDAMAFDAVAADAVIGTLNRIWGPA